MTIKELKLKLEGLPGDAQVSVAVNLDDLKTSKLDEGTQYKFISSVELSKGKYEHTTIFEVLDENSNEDEDIFDMVVLDIE